MTDHLTRGHLLYQQSHYALAEGEFRQAIHHEPRDPIAHALLGLSLIKLDKLKEAQAETEQAIELAPDHPFPHHCRSAVLQHRNHLAEAEQSAREALRLDPSDANYHAQLASTLYQQRKWQEALHACEQGLQNDAEHAACNNLRTMTLTMLGQQQEALDSVDQALARKANDEMAHTNKGWALLHAGKPLPALEHFREALRIAPNYEYAQQGMVEGLKARNPIYRWMLAYFLWMARLEDKTKWMVIIGGYVGFRLMRNATRSNPELTTWLAPFMVAYLAFVLMTWFAVPSFNLMLRVNRFGRHALSRDQRISSNWFALCLAVVLGGILLGLLTSADISFLIILFGAGMALPLVTLYNCEQGWPRQVMTGLAVGMAIAGTVAAVGEWNALAIGTPFFVVFVLGVVATPWLANYLAGVTVKR